MSEHATRLRIRFRVRFTRDYHVGAGHGEGIGLDSALFTDFGGGRAEPAIRYGHGVLRQAVYDLLSAPPLAGVRRCGASGDPAARRGGKSAQDYCIPVAGQPFTPCPVCRVFGSPAYPSPWSFATLRPVDRGTPGPGVRTVSRAGIDLGRRRARDATLFSEELGAPLEFEMEAERALDDEDAALDELSLLVAAAATVAGVGADRRRGRGECTVVMHACEGLLLEPRADAAALLTRFEAAWLAAAPANGRPVERPAPRAFTTPVAVGTWARAGGEAWSELRLVARLREPVIAGGRALTGNLLDSEPYIPGTLLLGALAAHVLARGGETDETEFLRVFRAGGVSFPDLLPAWESGERWRLTIPAPLDLLTCGVHAGRESHGGHGVWSTLRRDGEEAAKCPRCGGGGIKPKRLAGGYLAAAPQPAGNEPGYLVAPAVREETKIQIDPRYGRVLGESLYHRQTIPAGTLLAGRLRATAGALAALRRWGLFVETEGTIDLRVGKRHGRGYGAVTLAWSVAPGDDASALPDRVEAILDGAGAVPVMLASRAVLRDGWGRFRRTLRPEDLGDTIAALAVEAGAAVRAAGVGGFWTHMGMPRAQGFALVPGSVVWLKPRPAERASFTTALAALAAGAPIGERTAEGFGRVEVAPFPYAWTLAAPDPSSDSARKPGGHAAYEAFDLPTEVLPRRRDSRLRGEPRRADQQKLTEGVRSAGLNPKDDEWRTVARILYARAGDEAGALLEAIEGGGGVPRIQLAEAHAARTPKPFVTLGKGKDAWPSLRALVEKEAAKGLPEDERALRTRALADAIAAEVNPGKGTG